MFDEHHLALWIIFGAIVVLLLGMDLVVFNRKAHQIKMREALIWTIVWIVVSLLFNVGIYYLLGIQKALEFLTGYLVEKSLSVDNLFVFLVIFRYFRVTPEYQHRVLFWGVMGAIVFRAIMIFAGAALVSEFHWLLYVFGAFLLYTGVKLGIGKNQEDAHPDRHFAVRIAKKIFRVSKEPCGQNFFIRQNKRLFATPLLIVLVTIELSDVMFALDSIPAIFGITRDGFILLTSNVFAILGLRALFFLLAGFMGRFYYLNLGLSLVLGFIGLKMMMGYWYEIPTVLSLVVVVAILMLAVVFSLIRSRQIEKQKEGIKDPAGLK
jgi:tellurite resistance protein TerC